MKYLCLVYLDAERWAACSDAECVDYVQQLSPGQANVALPRPVFQKRAGQSQAEIGVDDAARVLRVGGGRLAQHGVVNTGLLQSPNTICKARPHPGLARRRQGLHQPGQGQGFRRGHRHGLGAAAGVAAFAASDLPPLRALLGHAHADDRFVYGVHEGQQFVQPHLTPWRGVGDLHVAPRHAHHDLQQRPWHVRPSTKLDATTPAAPVSAPGVGAAAHRRAASRRPSGPNSKARARRWSRPQTGPRRRLGRRFLQCAEQTSAGEFWADCTLLLTPLGSQELARNIEVQRCPKSTSSPAHPRLPCPCRGRAAPPRRVPSPNTGRPIRRQSRSTAPPARWPWSGGRPACE